MTQKLLTAETLREALKWTEAATESGLIVDVKIAPVILKAARLYLATLDAQPTPDTLNQSTCLENTINKSDNLKVSNSTGFKEPITEGDGIDCCHKCGSGDVRFCNISVRPYCGECKTWGAVNFGTKQDAINDWNTRATKTNDVNDINVADMSQAVDKQKNTTGITEGVFSNVENRCQSIMIGCAICADENNVVLHKNDPRLAGVTESCFDGVDTIRKALGESQ